MKCFLVIAAIAVADCKRSDHPGAPDPDPVAIQPSPSASVATAPKAAKDVVAAWDEAHRKRDAAALEALYAPKVVFYGIATTATDAAAKKRAAFAATPDYKQTLGAVTTEDTPDGRETWARFDKVTSEKSRIHTYPMLMRIDSGGRILEESDDDTKDDTWCMSGGAGDRGTSDRVVPALGMSSNAAFKAALASKEYARLSKSGAGINTAGGMQCARRCAKPSRDCHFHFRLESPTATTISNLAGWIEVDPIAKRVVYDTTFPDGGFGEASEPIR